LRDIAYRFALAQADVLGGEIACVAAKLEHSGFESDARAQRGFLENHGEGLAAQIRMINTGFALGLEAAGQREQSAKFGFGKRSEIEEVAFHRGRSFGAIGERIASGRTLSPPPARVGVALRMTDGSGRAIGEEFMS
jgi:hypothetical protein